MEVLGPALVQLSRSGLRCVGQMAQLTGVCRLMSLNSYLLAVCYFCPEMGFSSMISLPS